MTPTSGHVEVGSVYLNGRNQFVVFADLLHVGHHGNELPGNFLIHTPRYSSYEFACDMTFMEIQSGRETPGKFG